MLIPGVADSEVIYAGSVAGQAGALGPKEIQKRTFTKWINLYLKQRSREMHVSDLYVPWGAGLLLTGVLTIRLPPFTRYTDLRDGVLLKNLLEILSKKDLGKYKAAPKSVFEIRENLNLSFTFLKNEGVPLTNVGSEDIQSGNETITLALIWALILFYSVDSITIDGLSGKEGLLLWCQRQTRNVDGVEVKNFSSSWKDGLAFTALLSTIRPDKISVERARSLEPKARVEQAFSVAENYLDVDQVLDVEDIIEVAKVDDKILILALTLWFKGFAIWREAQEHVKTVRRRRVSS